MFHAYKHIMYHVFHIPYTMYSTCTYVIFHILTDTCVLKHYTIICHKQCLYVFYIHSFFIHLSMHTCHSTITHNIYYESPYHSLFIQALSYYTHYVQALDSNSITYTHIQCHTTLKPTISLYMYTSFILTN